MQGGLGQLTVTSEALPLVKVLRLPRAHLRKEDTHRPAGSPKPLTRIRRRVHTGLVARTREAKAERTVGEQHQTRRPTATHMAGSQGAARSHCLTQPLSLRGLRVSRGPQPIGGLAPQPRLCGPCEQPFPLYL